MLDRGVRLPRAVQTIIAWIGLLLMLASFVWLEWTSKPPVATREYAPPKHEPFAVVVLDPGHGGQDSGAMVAGILEKDLTLDITQRVDRLLQSQGLATVMTRVGDSYVSLAERAALTNRVTDCVLVSVHFNEGNKPVSSGMETYYADSGNKRVVLFGGFDSASGTYFNDLWVYSFATNTWSMMFPPAAPPARRVAAMVYDPVQKRIVLYGGQGPDALTDVWSLELKLPAAGSSAPAMTSLSPNSVTAGSPSFTLAVTGARSSE